MDPDLSAPRCRMSSQRIEEWTSCEHVREPFVPEGLTAFSFPFPFPFLLPLPFPFSLFVLFSFPVPSRRPVTGARFTGTCHVSLFLVFPLFVSLFDFLCFSPLTLNSLSRLPFPCLSLPLSLPFASSFSLCFCCAFLFRFTFPPPCDRCPVHGHLSR